MNPPMLGKERLEHLLYDVMGYTELRVNPTRPTRPACSSTNRSKSAAGSRELAASRGLTFGAKFSNTLEVENHRDFFQPTEKIMYLSGAPLHVITLTLADEFRQAVGAGVSDLLLRRRRSQELRQRRRLRHRAGHHLHRPPEDRRLRPAAAVPARPAASRWRRVGARTIDDFILDCRGQREAAGGDPVQAGFLNTPIIVAETQADPRYQAAQNRACPRKSTRTS